MELQAEIPPPPHSNKDMLLIMQQNKIDCQCLESNNNNLVDRLNGGKGHYEEMIIGSCGVRVKSDSFLPQETLCFVENRKRRKK